jgi:Tfp pilus assembly protein PilX
VPPSNARRPRSPEQGVVLVITLLLLSLLAALSLAMVVSVSSDSLINGYYRNYRGAFYAADSGINVARQTLVDKILAAIPAGSFSTTTAPIPAATTATVLSQVLSTSSSGYGSWTPINTNGASGSWNGNFEIVNTGANPTSLSLQLAPIATAPCPTTITYTQCNTTGTGASTTVTGYKYVYSYVITSVGQARGSEQTTIQDSGTLTFNVTVQPTPGTLTSFAGWAEFDDQSGLCDGSGEYQMPGLYTGPVATNGGWTFGTGSPGYSFQDPITSHSPNAGFLYSNGTCHSVPASSDKCTSGGCNGQTINPVFKAGLTLGVPTIALPQNSYSQERAVLDSEGIDTTPVTQSTLSTSNLKTVSGAGYPSSGSVTSGVYIPYTISGSGAGATNTLQGGGIYVEGSATVTLSTAGTSQQVFTIVQGTTTTTVTIDNTANTTTMASKVGSGSTTSIIMTGVPQQKDASANFMRDATMLFVDGTVTALSSTYDGSGNSLPAIQNGSAVTITAANDINITGDLRYVTEPVTMSQVGTTPADTLVPANNSGQVLGIFTSGGNINLNKNQTSNNMELDASVAAIGSGKNWGVTTGNNCSAGQLTSTLTVMGGIIDNVNSCVKAQALNELFDQRFQQGGFAPPWFPSTTVGSPGISTATISASKPQRTKWVVLSSN